MLYTKTGDDGTTGLIGNHRVSKCALRVQAYGDVDETNAAIGVALADCSDEEIAAILTKIQSHLFVLGAELAAPTLEAVSLCVTDSDVLGIERWIDEAEAQTSPLRNFVLPGGSRAAALLHLARTTCRRAERCVVALSQQEPVRPQAVVYLNRISDLLFALARLANRKGNIPDVPWHSQPVAPPKRSAD